MAMRKADPRAVGDFVEKLLNSGDYRRLIRGRYFRATVASVSEVAANQMGSYTLTIIRNGESAPDGDFYQCLVPGYVPQVGDDVEMVWRDESNAVVAYPVNRGGTGAGNAGIIKQIRYTSANAGVVPSFQNIPQHFTDLEFTYALRDTSAGTTIAFLTMTLNNNSTAIYYYDLAEVISTSLTPLGSTAQTAATCGLVVNGAAQGSSFAGGTITIYNYSSTLQIGVYDYRSQAMYSQAAAQQRLDVGGGNFNAGGAITRVDFGVSPAAGSVITLRGK